MNKIKDSIHKLYLNIVVVKESIEYDNDMQSVLEYITNASTVNQAFTRITNQIDSRIF